LTLGCGLALSLPDLLNFFCQGWQDSESPTLCFGCPSNAVRRSGYHQTVNRAIELEYLATLLLETGRTPAPAVTGYFENIVSSLSDSTFKEKLFVAVCAQKQ